MLGVLLNPAAEGNPDYTRSKIPGVSIRNSLKIHRLTSPRLIKSHSWFRSEIPRAVYLVRDGRDVLVSLYHYLITRQGKHTQFLEFTAGYLDGQYGQLWHENVQSWLCDGRKILGEDLLVIRFEELKKSTQKSLSRAAQFLHFPAEDQLLGQAVEAAGLTRMREIESRRRGQVKEGNQSFYRGGQSGEWRDYFSSKLENRFMEASGTAMELAGYTT